MSLRNWMAKILNYRPPDPALNNLTSGKTFQEKLKDLGVFEYDDNGFTLRYEEVVYRSRWREIDSMHMYKKDLMTIDRVELQIVVGDQAFTIHEDLPGWYQFLDRAKAALPTMMDDWEGKVIQSPFSMNWTTVYERAKQ